MSLLTAAERCGDQIQAPGIDWSGWNRAVTYPTVTLWALRLLVKGNLEREFLQAPIAALWKHILLPIAVVCFVSLLDTGATAGPRWPMIAAAGAVWLLFANSINCGGMVLWHERLLLRHTAVPVWLLLAAASLAPIGLFFVHLSLFHVGLLAGAFPRSGNPVETLVAAGIAAASGLGTGILAARLTAFRPRFAFALPKLLLASLVLTPVFYRPAALGGLEDAWYLANPLSVSTELARAGILNQVVAVPGHAIVLACALSGALLCWGLLTLRVPSASFAGEHA
jgi:ABC-type polysaccharide/polyol phosphate export permease